MRVTEERSHQSRVPHRGTGVLPAPTPEAPAGPRTGLHLSHLPVAIASAARGSRASGGVAGGCPRQQRPGMGGRPKHPSPLQESCRVLPYPCLWGAAPTTPLGLPGALQSPFGTHFLSGRTAGLPSWQCKPVCCTCKSHHLEDSSLKAHSSPPFLPPPRPAHLRPHPLITLHTLRPLYFLLWACLLMFFCMLSYLWLHFTERVPASWRQRAVLFEAGSLGLRMSDRTNGLSYPSARNWSSTFLSAH